MVEPFWYTDERPHSLAVISGWVRDEAAAIGADYIPGASHWIEHHPEWMADRTACTRTTPATPTWRPKMDAALTELGL